MKPTTKPLRRKNLLHLLPKRLRDRLTTIHGETRENQRQPSRIESRGEA